MARTLNSPVNDQRAEFVYLYEINHSGGILRLTNASFDITALSVSWTALGGRLVHGGAPDTGSNKGQGIELQLFGVDQSIISAIQNNQFRGRLIKIYLLHFDVATGVQDTPDLIFQGRQNGDYTIREDRDFDSEESGGVVTVSTRISADLAEINIKKSIRCNVASHTEFLRRAGQSTPSDDFFIRVPTLMGKNIYWGQPTPQDPRVGPGGVKPVPDENTQTLGWQ